MKKIILFLALVMLAPLCFASTTFAIIPSFTTDWGTEYFERVSDSGGWVDLKTPGHKYTVNGYISYCVEHDKTSPPNAHVYKEASADTFFDSTVRAGIRAILEHGHPSKSYGLSSAEARYATANALRAYIYEMTGVGYSWMDLSNNQIRPKAGYEYYFNWMKELVAYGRSRTGPGEPFVSVSPTTQKWQNIDNKITASMRVTTNGVETYTVSGVPDGITMSGYTGKSGDYLTFTGPESMIKTPLALSLSGYGYNYDVNINWYRPESGNYQGLLTVIDIRTGGTKSADAKITEGELAKKYYDLTVEKKDGSTGALLNGATFAVYQGNTLVESKAVSNGQAVFKLEEGSYEVRETVVPPGFIGAANQSVKLDSNKTLTFTNQPTELTVKKTDSFTSLPMSAAFRIKNDSGQIMKLKSQGNGVYRYDTAGSDTFQTGSDGNAKILALPNGKYTIEEPQPLEGYADMPPKSVTLNNTTSVSLINEPLMLEFNKTDSLSGNPLDDGMFTILDGSNAPVLLKQTATGEYTPDPSGSDKFTTQNGKVVIRYLPAGSYTLRELAPPDRYAPDQDLTVAISPANGISKPVKVGMKDEPLTLEFDKTDALTGDPLDGAVFELLDEDGNPIILSKIIDGVYEPDSDGENTFTTTNGHAVIQYLLAGDYTVREARPPECFMPDKDMPIAIGIENGTSDPARLGMKDEPLTLEFNKTDALTGEPLDGAMFELLDMDDNPVLLSKKDNGVYAPDVSGEETFTTENGRAVIYYLPVGVFTVREVASPEGFMPDQDKPVRLSITNGMSDPAKINMTDEPLTLEFDKTDALTGKSLDGAVFELLDEDGAPVLLSKKEDGVYAPDSNGKDTFTTKNGHAVIYYLPIGEFTVREADAPEGFMLDQDKPVRLSITNGMSDPAKISMADEPLTLEFDKTDALTGMPLDGAVFELLDEDDNPVSLSKKENGVYAPDSSGEDTFTTKNGRAIICYLPVGLFTVRETVPPSGFMKDAPKDVEIAPHNGMSAPARAKMLDKPLVLEISKIDSSTGEPVGGAEFSLLGENGDAVRLSPFGDTEGRYKPDADGGDVFAVDGGGKALILYLSYGSYEIIETQAPPGFIKLVGPVPISINDNGTHLTEIAIENEPTKLMLQKTDATTDTPLDGAVFRLSDEDGNILLFTKRENGEYHTDPNGSEGIAAENGSAVISHLPIGRLILEEIQPPTGFSPITPVQIEVTDAHNADAPLEITVPNKPLALIIRKITRNFQPLQGAGFSIKAKDKLDKPLSFTQDDQDVYRYTPASPTTATVMVDDKGEALVHGLPEGEYVLEETVVPAGYFPAVPKELTIKAEHDTDNPCYIAVVNEPVVKLGLDDDKYNLLLLFGLIGIAILCGKLYLSQKNKTTKENENGD